MILNCNFFFLPDKYQWTTQYNYTNDIITMNDPFDTYVNITYICIQRRVKTLRMCENRSIRILQGLCHHFNPVYLCAYYMRRFRFQTNNFFSNIYLEFLVFFFK